LFEKQFPDLKSSYQPRKQDGWLYKFLLKATQPEFDALKEEGEKTIAPSLRNWLLSLTPVSDLEILRKYDLTEIRQGISVRLYENGTSYFPESFYLSFEESIEVPRIHVSYYAIGEKDKGRFFEDILSIPQKHYSFFERVSIFSALRKESLKLSFQWLDERIKDKSKPKLTWGEIVEKFPMLKVLVVEN